MASSTNRRLASAVFLGVAAAGAGLLAGIRLASPAPAAAAAQGPVEAAWISQAPKREIFLSSLEAPTADASENEDLAALVAEEIPLLSALTFGSADWELIRVLPRGHEFMAGVQGSFERRGPESGSAETRIVRDGEIEVIYRAEVEDGELTQLTLSPQGDDTQLKHIDLGEDVPISLGDLRMDDILQLSRAFESGEVEESGRLVMRNSREQVVFSVEFASNEASGDEDAEDEREGIGASALVYCDARDLTPRSVRIFDREERLIRTYWDFGYATVEAAPGSDEETELRLQSLRVDSRPTSSSTSLRLTGVELESGA